MRSYHFDNSETSGSEREAESFPTSQSQSATQYLPAVWSLSSSTKSGATGRANFNSPVTANPPLPPREESGRKKGTSFTRRFSRYLSRSTLASFQSPLGKSHQTMQRLSLTTIDLHAAGDQKKQVDQVDLEGFHISEGKFRKKKKTKDNTLTKREKILGLFLFLAVVASFAMAMILVTSDSNQSSERNSDEPSQPTSTDFCQSGDSNIRQLLADRFDEMFVEGVVTYNGVIIDCLPSDAFSELSATQKLNLQTSTQLEFNGNAMRTISEDAFNTSELSSITKLLIVENGISFLPNNLLEPLTSLREVSFARNALVDIQTEVFRRSTVNVITLDINPLVVTPSALRNLPNLQSLFFTSCPALVAVEDGLLSASVGLTSVGVGGTSLRDFFETAETLASQLGIEASTLVGF